MPKPPALSAAQRREGFLRALELRRQRAELKQQIRDGLPIWSAWHRPEAQGMKVLDLILAVRGIGELKAGDALRQAGIKPTKSVRSCGPGQRERLFRLL